MLGISVVETTVIKKADKAIFDGCFFILLFLNCVNVQLVSNGSEKLH